MKKKVTGFVVARTDTAYEYGTLQIWPNDMSTQEGFHPIETIHVEVDYDPKDIDAKAIEQMEKKIEEVEFDAHRRVQFLKERIQELRALPAPVQKEEGLFQGMVSVAEYDAFDDDIPRTPFSKGYDMANSALTHGPKDREDETIRRLEEFASENFSHTGEEECFNNGVRKAVTDWRMWYS